ncbi:sodium:proton antiporter [Enterovibrio norvegicus]|uniref:Monovalent cation:H+ antiporter, CPA1 family n=1 Tax=Enterovibrio norvegicus DSM 15893 TaxID=1121869 RepID=A0A1I5LYF7_9GAMM|nr:sodium:proton antiporter [Enterovibrio norvegicus]OEE43618.1 sodium:proton antiporter [Enterovibrio norvegicus]OEF61019.1 sodium:proton antiporter [Enterovibrio norvegicus]SFP01801.1 monovalent cation:H+ antiporter, CPA1 family [Enterovibrio norvegicus DSM 15893]
MTESVPTLVTYAVLGWMALNVIFYVSEKWRVFSDIIWILLAGIAYGWVSTNPESGLPELVMDPDVVLYVFVPLLIFASTKKMCLFHFRPIIVPAVIAGTLGIVVSMLTIGLAIHGLLDVALLPALLFGVIISATDPLAVSALFKGNESITENQKLLIEGESILNDGFVVTVAGILALLIFSMTSFSVVDTSVSFVTHIAGALISGALLGRLARFILRLMHTSHYILTTNITLALAYGSFVVAETLHFSGILAVFAAALAYGYKPDKDRTNRLAEERVWEYLDYAANALLFFLLGTSFFALTANTDLPVSHTLLAIGLLFAGRFVALSLLKPLMRVEGMRLSMNEFWLLNFSGARGAVSVALILLLPADFEYQSLFLSLAFVMILFSLLVYPLVTVRILSKMTR